MTRENLLIVADSERDANMLYAAGFLVPDPFIYLRIRGKPHLVLNDLEIDRARRSSRHCRLIRLSTYLRKLKREGFQTTDFARVISTILRERRLKKIVVPGNFPLALARELRALKIKVKAKDGSFFAEREIKTSEDVKKISAALIMAEVGVSEGIQALKNAKIGRDGRLFYHHVPLTSEKLRSIIEIAIIQAGGRANHTIVATGHQSCDPHEHGSGPLRANQPIILDVFPRSQKTGYFADMSRTVVKGRASEAARRLYAAVARAQDLALAQLRDGSPTLQVHRTVEQFFKKEGFRTGRRNGRMEGFFHGTGHGLGLEIHEPPRINPTSKDFLRAGQVVTVEPGLYYPGVGGIRLEDVALVTTNAPKNLTKFEKTLEV
ncbi:MAG: aminopeptidase P family protein [Verrucomicrobia bacterium]|nr:aminopeptidase P family protein [Verrucomicrobiota bacterium]